MFKYAQRLVATACAHLGNLPPVETVKKVVGPSLVGVGLQCGLHPWSSGNPDPLLLMVPPVSVEPTQHTRTESSVLLLNSVSVGVHVYLSLLQLHSGQQLQQVSSIHIIEIEEQVFTVPGQLDGSQLHRGKERVIIIIINP